MLPLAALSRRALVASGVLAAAPSAAARKRRKPKPPVPLAFLAIAIRGVSYNQAAGTFVWSYDAQFRHPESGFTKNLSGTITHVNSDASDSETRAAIVWGARSLSRTFLQQAGHDVPEERIAAVVL